VLGLIVGFALIQHSLSFSAKPVSVGANLLLSGDTFFTLGTASLTSISKVRRSVAVFEAGTGLAFLAMVIGYLPVLYQLFSRRETHVIMSTHVPVHLRTQPPFYLVIAITTVCTPLMNCSTSGSGGRLG
jgi:hypothetical protein